MSRSNHVSTCVPLSGRRAWAVCLNHVQHGYNSDHLVGVTTLHGDTVCFFARIARVANGDRVPISWGSPPCVSV